MREAESSTGFPSKTMRTADALTVVVRMRVANDYLRLRVANSSAVKIAAPPPPMPQVLPPVSGV